MLLKYRQDLSSEGYEGFSAVAILARGFASCCTERAASP